MTVTRTSGYLPRWRGGYLEMITFFNRLWKEKLMDPEFFTTSSKMATEKMVKGDMLVRISTDDASWKMEIQHKASYPDSKLDYEIVLPIRSKSMPERAVSRRQSVNLFWSWAVSSKAKNLDRIMRIIDWMYSEEGSIRCNCGIEGVHFNWVVQDGQRRWKFVPELIREYNPEGKYLPREKYHLRNPFTGRLVRDYYDEFRAENEFMKAHYATLDKMKGYERNFDSIEVAFTDEQHEQIMDIVTDLQTYVDENTIKFITGDKPLSEYPAFKEELVKLGAIYADAYAEWKKNLAK
jgi:putative aldouronate transport system substrate-binding protein